MAGISGTVGGGRGRGAKYRHLYEEAQARCIKVVSMHFVRSVPIMEKQSLKNAPLQETEPWCEPNHRQCASDLWHCTSGQNEITIQVISLGGNELQQASVAGQEKACK